MINLIIILGRKVINFTREIGYFFRITYFTIGSLFQRPALIRETIDQAVIVGVNSLSVVTLTSLFTGMITSLQAGIVLQSKFVAAISMMGAMIGWPIVRGLGPILTALIITARSGSAMAAEIGTMKVTEQIDALVTLSADPIHFVLVPRFVALSLMVPVLVAYADLVGIFGGYLVAHYQFENSYDLFMENLIQFCSVSDFIYGIVNGFFYGGLIAAICCAQGFATRHGAEGVGRSTTKAVVYSCIGILIASFLLTQISVLIGI